VVAFDGRVLVIRATAAAGRWTDGGRVVLRSKETRVVKILKFTAPGLSFVYSLLCVGGLNAAPVLEQTDVAADVRRRTRSPTQSVRLLTSAATNGVKYPG